jgi:hypothetical protein
MAARLELTHPNGHREHRTLGLGRYRIGREGAEIVLADANVSTFHAELIVEPGRLVLTDLGSVNGTFGPDGQRITTPIALYAGQVARLGGSALALLELSAAPQRVRGTVIKVPDATPGLLVSGGRQFPFQIAGIWRSPAAPAANQTLDIELDERGALLALTVVDGQQGSARRAPALLLGVAGVAVLGLVGAGWWLLGSDLSKRSLAATIDESLATKDAKVCWDVSGRSPLTFPVRLSNVLGEVSQNPIAIGLHKGGYITLTPERPRPGASLTDHFGQAHQFVLDITPKGKDELVWDPSRGFCVGRRGVHSVERWTEPTSTQGVQTIRIDYKWKVVARPSWANDQLFSDVPGVAEPVEAIAMAQKTSDGWTVVHL